MSSSAGTPITKEIFDEVVDKLVKMDGDLGQKMDNDVAAMRQDNGLLSTSIKNLQTQILEGHSRFDKDAFSSSNRSPPPPPQPLHKLCFPKYDGVDDPITWLHKGEQFFRAYDTPDHLKVQTASFYLEDAAGQWYYRLEKNQGTPTWPLFVEAVIRHFGPPCAATPLASCPTCAAPARWMSTRSSSFSCWPATMASPSCRRSRSSRPAYSSPSPPTSSCRNRPPSRTPWP